MRIDSNTISNLAFTAACLVFATLGGLRIWERVHPPARSAPEAVAEIAPIDISLDARPVQGDQKAKLALIEFSDFQCPFCGQYVKATYADIKREFVETGKVKYAFVNLPLGLHQYARGAAEAAACAHLQGRFWPMHDRLFARQDLLKPSDLSDSARELGLDVGTFEACRAAAGRDIVTKDLELAKRLGLNGTPTFVIGTVNPDGTIHVTKKFAGTRTIEVFRQALTP